MSTELRFTAILACHFVTPSLQADPVDAITLRGAVRAAEEFLLERGYGTERSCPDGLRYKDQAGEYDMQPHCQAYSASEVEAYAETESFWRVFFRKVPPSVHDGLETYRVVHVCRAGAEPESVVTLHDVELLLDKEATILR
jgi:hypothetical protein